MTQKQALFDAEETAHYLGVSLATLYRGVKSGAFPRQVRLPGGRSTRWKREDLDAFVAALGNDHAVSASQKIGGVQSHD